MKTRILFYLVSAVILAGCATTQDFMVLDDRLTELERERVKTEQEQDQLDSRIVNFSKIQESKDQDFMGQYAGLHAELKKLRGEVRLLHGRLDEIDFAIKKMRGTMEGAQAKLDRLDQTATGNTDRIRGLEQYLGLEKDHGKGTTTTAAVQGSEQELYTRAMNLYNQKKYEPARLGFQKLLKEYPRSKNADNAQFWIGETYYQEKWYEKAILEYEEVKKKYPKGNKMPSALLKQGLSFKQLGEKGNARVILNELIRKYPKSKEAAVARKKLATL